MRALAVTAWVLVAAQSGAAPVIVIDPGHGGVQGGAVGAAGQLEKNVALELAQRLKAALERELSATVHLTRDRDAHVMLGERVELANRHKPDLFISVHLNSMPTTKQRASTSGVETYFLSASATGDAARSVAARENAEVQVHSRGAAGDTLAFILADLQRSETLHDSSRLAYAVHEALISQTGAVDRRVQQAPFFVLMGLEAPAILVELGFISHPEEGKRLTQAAYQEKLAQAMAAGVKRYLAQVETRDGRKAPVP